MEANENLLNVDYQRILTDLQKLQEMHDSASLMQGQLQVDFSEKSNAMLEKWGNDQVAYEAQRNESLEEIELIERECDGLEMHVAALSSRGRVVVAAAIASLSAQIEETRALLADKQDIVACNEQELEREDERLRALQCSTAESTEETHRLKAAREDLDRALEGKKAKDVADNEALDHALAKLQEEKEKIIDDIRQADAKLASLRADQCAHAQEIQDVQTALDDLHIQNGNIKKEWELSVEPERHRSVCLCMFTRTHI